MWGASARAHVHTSFARWCLHARSFIADQGVILVCTMYILVVVGFWKTEVVFILVVLLLFTVIRNSRMLKTSRSDEGARLLFGSNVCIRLQLKSERHLWRHNPAAVSTLK